jgi:hypothetical protein
MRKMNSPERSETLSARSHGGSQHRIVGRVPVRRRFWGVINYRGDVWPTAISNHRDTAKKRFLTHPEYGWGGSWRAAYRKGFRCVRLSIVPHTTEAELRKTIVAYERQRDRLNKKLWATANGGVERQG